VLIVHTKHDEITTFNYPYSQYSLMPECSHPFYETRRLKVHAVIDGGFPLESAKVDFCTDCGEFLSINNQKTEWPILRLRGNAGGCDHPHNEVEEKEVNIRTVGNHNVLQTDTLKVCNECRHPPEDHTPIPLNQ